MTCLGEVCRKRAAVGARSDDDEVMERSRAFTYVALRRQHLRSVACRGTWSAWATLILTQFGSRAGWVGLSFPAADSERRRDGRPLFAFLALFETVPFEAFEIEQACYPSAALCRVHS